MVIAFSNLRGGPGKTTSTIISAGILSQSARVLCIDCDPQASLTRYYGISEKNNLSLVDVMMNKNKRAIKKIKKNFHVINSSIELVDMAENKNFINLRGCELLLLQAIAKIKNDYDYILLDCPPALSIVTVNALIAAEVVICPVDLDSDSYVGAEKLISNIESIRQSPIGFILFFDESPSQFIKFNSYE